MNSLSIDAIQWDKGDGLVPAIIQHAITGQVLMLGYMNAEALQQTLGTQRVTFYSRSQQRLWTKGETSGHHLDCVDVALDCDGDTLLVLAKPHGPVCHLLTPTCFGKEAPQGTMLTRLARIIDQRASSDDESSYTRALLNEGLSRCAQKVGEEGVEVALAATSGSSEDLNEEAADLLYHLLVLLQSAGSDLESVMAILDQRHQATRS